MKCRHKKVRAFAKPQRKGEWWRISENCICPDCNKPIEAVSIMERLPEDTQGSFRVANYSMAGVGDYWKVWNGETFVYRKERKNEQPL